MSVETVEALRKSLVVAAPIEKAWDVFVDKIGEWWPLDSKSLAGEDAEAAVIDGERIYERTKDGRELTWGRILIWEPPTRLAFTWEVNPRGETAVDISFTPEGDGTRVDLVHRGWESRGDEAAEARASYDEGWDFVLGHYVKATRS